MAGQTQAGSDVDGLPTPVVAPHPLGVRQHAFWILQQLAPESTVSNISIVLRTRQPLRWWPLHATLEHLIHRHPALRTRFPTSAGVPLVHVSAASDVVLDVAVDAVTEAGLDGRLGAESGTPFDLAAQLPIRVSLLQLDDGSTVLHLLVHHIVCDASSLAELTGELARTYDGIAAGTGVPADLLDELPVAPEQASDPDDVRYWAQSLHDVDLAGLALPGSRPAPARPTFAGATYLVDPRPGTAAAVARLRRIGATGNIVYLAAFALDLVRNGAGPDLVIGVPVVNRAAPRHGLGFRVSTLPLRITVDLAAGFAELLRTVRTAFLAGADHASASAEEIFAALGSHSGDWRVPLFRHMFNYRPWDEGDVLIGGERPESLTVLRPQSRLDLQFAVLDREPAAQYLVNHSTEVHDEADVRALLLRMEMLLQAAADDPARPVGELGMATSPEAAAMRAANDTAAPALLEPTLLEQFHAAAAAHPDAPAVLDGDVTFSYGEVAESARRVATALRALGTGRGDVVALALPRSPAALAVVLGVWSLGAAYLPLDAGHPAQRIAAQLADVAVTAVLTDGVSVAPEPAGIPVLTWADIESTPDTATADGVHGSDTAYVIHTSGSTGRPRGVVISHRSLANVVRDFAARLGLGAGDRVLWSTTMAFDISGLEMCLPLSVGGTLVIAGPQTKPRELLDTAVRADVAVIQATPTFWRGTVGITGDALRGRTVLCGGEPMPADLAGELLAAGCRLFNVYGPTETTIWSTVAEIDGPVTDPVSIGRPIANTTVAVVDERGAELPPGLLGELCIGGAGVATGYAGQPELTAERFPDGPDGRRYRTGDLARWLPDGSLELFGRNDRQVKVRGHRIELPEIESILRLHPLLSEAVAVVAGAGGPDAQLRVFVRLQPGAPAQEEDVAEQLWSHLATRMPSAALPSSIQVVTGFPTTPNGKVDHNALRAMDPVESAPSRAPRSDADPALTRRLVALWREVLARPALDERAHFFLNGGHSLLATRLATRLAETEHRDVGLRAVFDHPTPAALSTYLTRRETS